MTIREMMTMYHSVKFVEELIDYIAEYPDDDYMTMECLCRKLFKYGLIDKKDGYYLVADGIKADRKTEPEPQTDIGTSDTVYSDTAGYVPRADMTDCSWK